MELFRALASLLEPPCAEHRAVAAAAGLPPPPAPDEHTDVLVFQAYPYGSVYLGGEGMLGGEARDRIAGFWRALGGEPPGEPDHLGCLLAALARLAEEEADARSPAVRAARRALYWDHVASWMPPYLSMLRRIGGDFFAAWADLAEAALSAEADLLGPPARLALHLRMAPSLEEPGDLDRLLELLLVPARTGFAVTRDDLLRAAAELGLGCRAGERRYALRSLLEQDAGDVLRWLAAEAARQATVCERSPLPTAGWWSERARAASGWLESMAAGAGA